MLFTSLEVFPRYFLGFLFKVDVVWYFATFEENILLFVNTFFLKKIVCNMASTMMPLPDSDPSKHVLSASLALNNIIYFSYILVFAKPPQPSPSVILRYRIQRVALTKKSNMNCWYQIVLMITVGEYVFGVDVATAVRLQRCRSPPSTVKPERVARFIKADWSCYLSRRHCSMYPANE